MFGTVSRSFTNFKKFVRHVSDDIRNMPTYHPDYLDKKILVHFKHYPSIEEVPERVSQHVMNKVKTEYYCISFFFYKTFIRRNPWLG